MDYTPIEQWIAPQSRVLDLGCGEGVLLDFLRERKSIRGLGVEIDSSNINACINKKINVIEQDIDRGLGNFADNSFDTVLLTQTLQAVHQPDLVLSELLRVGKEGIISFPNFGHWQSRFYLLRRGKMPVSKFMPFNWYDSPNIHFCTIKDFEELCNKKGIAILNRKYLHSNGAKIQDNMLFANLTATHAIYHVTR